MFRLDSARRASVASACLLLSGVIGHVVPISADDDPAPDAAVLKKQRDMRLVKMREQAEMFRVERIVNGERRTERLTPEPVFRYADQPRGFLDATLWYWEAEGRPLALAKVEMSIRPYKSPAARWQFCLASLAETPIEVRFGSRGVLGPKKPGVELRPVKGGPIPSDKPAERLRQMREIIARFKATIHVPDLETREEMRVLSSPIHRYGQVDSALQDGVIFGLATSGTNPSMLILIELRGNKESGPEWYYGIVKMTSDEVHLRLDDSEIWSSPHAAPLETLCYFDIARDE
jgi:hypothetical protein